MNFSKLYEYATYGLCSYRQDWLNFLFVLIFFSGKKIVTLERLFVFYECGLIQAKL